MSSHWLFAQLEDSSDAESADSDVAPCARPPTTQHFRQKH
jgi:hypothetical protein